MGTDYDIYFAFLQIVQDFLNFSGFLHPADIFHPTRHAFQPPGKSMVMLISQNSRRHQDSHLFAIGHRLKSGPDCNFSLPKSHISTDQAVHYLRFFHIGFYRFDRFYLIGSLVIHKRHFHFFLQITIFRKSKSSLFLAAGIEGDQLPCNIFYPGLSLLFKFIPGISS